MRGQKKKENTCDHTDEFRHLVNEQNTVEN